MFMVSRRTALAGTAATALGATLPVLAQEGVPLIRETVSLVSPPFVHPHQQATQDPPKIIAFTLVAEEKPLVIDDQGTTLQAMTFNGTIPGPLMVVHEGDYLELTLVNPETNVMAHNIDFHASTGALGGGGLTMVNPGEQVVLRFKATRAGAFIYHCAPGGSMIPWHVVSGMHGAVMVLPRNGLADEERKPLHYERIYYVGESDLYIPRDEGGKFKSYGSLAESYADTLAVMRGLVPTPCGVQRQGRRADR
jgi:nitrite reductase (NO-forming)